MMLLLLCCVFDGHRRKRRRAEWLKGLSKGSELVVPQPRTMSTLCAEPVEPEQGREDQWEPDKLERAVQLHSTLPVVRL